MSREQRQQSARRAALRARLDAFADSPSKLSEVQTTKLLGDLCEDLGLCEGDIEAYLVDPPTNPVAFTDRVRADNNLAADDSLYMTVLSRALAVFEGAAHS